MICSTLYSDHRTRSAFLPPPPLLGRPRSASPLLGSPQSVPRRGTAPVLLYAATTKPASLYASSICLCLPQLGSSRARSV
ncbi:hypothetical protein E2562_025354 [Oryza meyeriana var. granulata]|uniref:Uncharacterized protein n=1 Tax=Oryza meyeriana var. granulata TaxID=110450 RepID=A0A6G1DNB2_9ORYZ|nr:hypothetical protein E2562_025354 [Oryza meyeriana var. granulata]